MLSKVFGVCEGCQLFAEVVGCLECLMVFLRENVSVKMQRKCQQMTVFVCF